MGRNNSFQFKQFTVIQEKSPMKVGTDGVLLGAWVNIKNVRKILDIGTGTGVIALIMAQRSKAEITGIEIEKNAAGEAGANVKNSIWNDRIKIYNISFQEYAQNSNNLFDLIICNPPFFIESKKSSNPGLSIAKHNDLLSLNDLADMSVKLLEPAGRLAVILPVKEAGQFVEIVGLKNLYLYRATEVKPKNVKKPIRLLMEFSRNKKEPERSYLTIHNDDGSGFTKQYKNLTKDFYINF